MAGSPLALVPFLLAAGLSPFLMRKRVDQLGSQAREAAGELGAFAVDSVQGLGEIVAFQQEASRGTKLDQLSQRHISLRLPFFRELTRQQAMLEVLIGLGGLAVVVTGAALAQHGALDPGLLPLMTILAMAAFLPVSEIAQIGRQLADTLGATRRVYALANEPIPVRDGTGRGAAQAAPRRWRWKRSTSPIPARAAARSPTSASRFPPARPWRWSAPRAPARRRRRSC